jgi:hypothetical protein
MVELIVSLVILGIIGAAMVRLMLGESRNVDRLMLQRSARGVTRSSVNLLLSELRMAIPAGVVAATPASIELYVPYALGISCGKSSGATVVSLLPVDSAVVDEALYGGFAWRGSGGQFAFNDTLPVLAPSSAAVCIAARITTMSGGRVVSVSPSLPDTATTGTPVFLLQRLRYWFGPSSELPGSVALMRTRVKDGVTEELASPFDSTSHFQFYRVGADTSEANPPSVLSDVRGIELVVTGLSTRKRFRATKVEQARQRTSVYFTNGTVP